MTTDYDDIILLPHHISRRRKPMPVAQRAAQFAPFAALSGYGSAIQTVSHAADAWDDSVHVASVDDL